jgi:hypothetical protein
LGLTLDNTLSWKTHIDQLRPKLNMASYVIRSLRSVISAKKLRTIYCSYVHSIIAYGTIFCGNATYYFQITEKSNKNCYENDIFNKLPTTLTVHSVPENLHTCVMTSHFTLPLGL